MQNKIKIPKTQQSWVRYIKDGNPTHIITSDLNRTKYFLYKVNDDGEIEKIASSQKPLFKGFNL